MTKQDLEELIRQSIKDLEWSEDYHQRKLDETVAKLDVFRDKLKSLQDDI